VLVCVSRQHSKAEVSQKHVQLDRVVCLPGPSWDLRLRWKLGQAKKTSVAVSDASKINQIFRFDLSLKEFSQSLACQGVVLTKQVSTNWVNHAQLTFSNKISNKFLGISNAFRRVYCALSFTGTRATPRRIVFCSV
jgi:hypothetical protein